MSFVRAHMNDLSAVRVELLELEERLVRPEVRQSADSVSALLADTFVEFGSSGRVFNKQQIVEALSKESGVHFEISEFNVVPLSAEAMLATYVATRREPAQPDVLRSLRSTVWLRQGGSWRALFHQGTNIRGAYAR